MTVSELKDYRCWVGKSAQTVYLAALAAGGWEVVFPTRVPRWASRVRNYFNVTPQTLERLPEDVSRRALRQVQRFAFLLDCHAVQTFNRTHQDRTPNPWGKPNPPPFKVPAACPVKAERAVVHTGIKAYLGTTGALAGVVHKDGSGRVWYQMAAGSTIYHYGRRPTSAALEAVAVDKIRGQDDTPVFKLISPDNTGGSCEVILWNDGVNAGGWGTGSEVLGGVGERWDVRKLIVTDPRYQGSYNYAETVRVGLAAHELRDVKPHVEGVDFYVNPADRFCPPASRRFLANDPQGKPLATQV